MNERQPFLDSEVLALCRGERMGSGTYRDVYQFLPDTSIVLKEERTAYKFDNVAEWELWQVATGNELENWLARCLTISPSGGVLMQERTFPISPQMLPAKVPAILRDVKAENWGFVWRKGKKLIVCHDYAHNAATKSGLGKTLKLVTAAWHDPSYSGWAK